MAKTFITFAATFVVLFALLFTFLAGMDLLPEPISEEPQEQSAIEVHTTATPTQTQGELPVRIVAPSIGMDNTVLNPQSTSVAVLDEALLKGTVRYPTSGTLGVNGTVLIFGHSSYLPVVRNQNYKAFNGIQKLKEGEQVSLFSATREYRYTVMSVRVANAEEDVVELPDNGQFLTLITCDTFGKKSSRFIVTATLDEVRSI